MSQVAGQMHCKNCRRGLAEVRDGRLFLAGVELRGAVLVCPGCGRECPWHAQKPRKAQEANAPPVRPHSGA
jgi:hypothetical protein